MNQQGQSSKPNKGCLASSDQYRVNQPAMDHSDDADADAIEEEEASDRKDVIGHEPLPETKNRKEKSNKNSED
ncbi:hypothetical protein D6851_05060 [Altericroceibacterium spongiae]|uniref:Uncharacterized protein n=1 Tax=Altericroceibacterium spongiae TaxID=2320269 RepID=A0A420EPJ5_9SPHN|nr:hypothetical protein [Altericroceibacterium spongiae]RKF22590.1 hypothetical protein D6851_05060 [Altericroceibacterium spongiae]